MTPKFRSRYCGNCRQFKTCRTKPKRLTFIAMREKALRCSWYVKLVCYGDHDGEDCPDPGVCLHCEAISKCISLTVED
jgi:hypothetical protein